MAKVRYAPPIVRVSGTNGAAGRALRSATARERTLTSDAGQPFVSVIMPVRNEERHIADSLRSLLGNRYPEDRLEIIVVDGKSTDRTWEIAERELSGYRNARIFGNRKVNAAAGLNLGLKLARGEVIVIAEGHTIYAQDYVARCVEELDREGADNVGGPQVPVENGRWARLVAYAYWSGFGLGKRDYLQRGYDGPSDTTYLGCFRRATLEKVGGFRGELAANHDDEMNFRLREYGGKVYVSHRIRSRYYPRNRLRDLVRQFFRYGFWKVRVFQLHPRAIAARHLVPTFLVGAIAASVVLGAVWTIADPRMPPHMAGGWVHWLPLMAVIGLYVSACLVVSGMIAVRKGLHCLLRMPLVFAGMHLAYGTGFLAGLARFVGRPAREGS